MILTGSLIKRNNALWDIEAEMKASKIFHPLEKVKILKRQADLEWKQSITACEAEAEAERRTPEQIYTEVRACLGGMDNRELIAANSKAIEALPFKYHNALATPQSLHEYVAEIGELYTSSLRSGALNEVERQRLLRQLGDAAPMGLNTYLDSHPSQSYKELLGAISYYKKKNQIGDIQAEAFSQTNTPIVRPTSDIPVAETSQLNAATLSSFGNSIAKGLKDCLGGDDTDSNYSFLSVYNIESRGLPSVRLTPEEKQETVLKMIAFTTTREEKVRLGRDKIPHKCWQCGGDHPNAMVVEPTQRGHRCFNCPSKTAMGKNVQTQRVKDMISCTACDGLGHKKEECDQWLKNSINPINYKVENVVWGGKYELDILNRFLARQNAFNAAKAGDINSNTTTPHTPGTTTAPIHHISHIAALLELQKNSEPYPRPDLGHRGGA